jgi:hypothetical protein
MRLDKRILAAFAFAGALVLLSAFSGGKAFAYGPTHVYEITFSFNCQNHALCQVSASNPFGIGGFWGWVELDAGGTGDGQAEFQGHDNAYPALNGTGHVTFQDLSWTTFSVPGVGSFLSILAPAEFGPQPMVLPAGSGHYTQHPAPGISNDINVTLLP